MLSATINDIHAVIVVMVIILVIRAKVAYRDDTAGG